MGVRRIGWRLAAVALVVLASPVALGSAASANCLATLHARPRTVQAGATVFLNGKNYSSSPTTGNIDIRLDKRDGPVIASFSPRSWLVDVPVTIPLGTAPGIHTLLATQHTPAAQLASCGPGRATVEVAPAARAPAAAAGEAATGRAPVARDLLLPTAAALGLVLLLAARRKRSAPGRGRAARFT